MAQYSKFSEGYFTVGSSLSKFISLPYLPNTFEIWNKTQWGAAPSGATPIATAEYAIGYAEDAAGTYYAYGAAASSSSAALLATTGTSNGFTFISAGTYQYGPTLTLASTFVSKATAALVTTSSAHGYSVGDVVLLYGTTGMLQVAGILYSIQTVPSTTTFTISVNSSSFANAATAGFVKRLLYADLYVPEGSSITAVSTGTTTTITTALNHKFVVGQEVAFVVPSQWGMVQLDSQNYLQSHFQPQQAYVTSIPNPNQIVVNVNSTGYTAFSYPTSATAALGLTPAQVVAIGDQNSGGTLVPPLAPVPPAITIPGAFYANTRQGVLMGSAILPQASDVIRWRATYPDQILIG